MKRTCISRELANGLVAVGWRITGLTDNGQFILEHTDG